MFAGDVGAIFACVAAGQAISGFATPLYNKIYIAVIERKDCQDLNFWHFFQTLSWNVGAVYLVACAFQALILVCAIYTLIFLKSVLSNKISCKNWEAYYIWFTFSDLPCFQEERVEEPRAKCCDNIILSLWPFLICCKDTIFLIVTFVKRG